MSADDKIAARALRDAADELDDTQPTIPFRVVTWLRQRAEKIEQGAS